MNFSQLGFGFFVLKIHGIFIALIFSLVAWLFYRKLEKESLDTNYFVNHLWQWVVVGIILGRIFSLILDPGIIANNGWYSFLTFWDGGINYYGALLGGLGMMFYDLKKSEHDSWKWLDYSAPYFLTIACLNDLAAFLTGNIYGTETSLPWGIQYETFGVETISPVHPVTIYAFIIHLILLNWVIRYGKNFYRQKGKLILITTIVFFFAEFFLQFFRGDETLILFNVLRIEQIFALITVFALTIYLRKR